jgi:hypothetical protein
MMRIKPYICVERESHPLSVAIAIAIAIAAAIL